MNPGVGNTNDGIDKDHHFILVRWYLIYLGSKILLRHQKLLRKGRLTERRRLESTESLVDGFPTTMD